MDADEILQADALKYSARLFLENDNVIAVGGLIRIANGVKFEHAIPVEMRMSRNCVVSMQILEYNRSFMASRVFQDTFNGNLNISGGYGLFNKKSAILVGGYDPDAVGEDMDLVLKLHVYYRLHNMPYSIKYTSDAVCWTQAPFTVKDLWKQRARWQRGLIQCMWKHKVLFLNPRYGLVSLVSFMYYFLYELLAPFIELLGTVVILTTFIMGSLNIRFAIIITLLYTCFSILQTLLFYLSKYFLRGDKYYKGDFCWCIFMCFADVVFFRPILFIVRISAFLDYKKKLHSWSQLERENMEEG
jgi:cellulose synthase/poly-beta-1,6-N-acetylglucosamine synthase-like glycosyltransferase